MPKHRDRYDIISIPLGTQQLTPREISIGGARAITFIRFAKDNEGRYPEHYPHEFFQIAIDNSQHFIPFKPNDTLTIPPGSNDTFDRIWWRNLRAVSGYAYIMVSRDICPAHYGQRPDTTFPLKNSSGPEQFVARDYGSEITVLAGATATILTTNIPAYTMLLLWDFTIWQREDIAAPPTSMVDYIVQVWASITGTIKVFTKLCKTGQDTNALIWTPGRPLEYTNDTNGVKTFSIIVRNLAAATDEKFGGSMSFSLVPIYITNPKSEFLPFAS